MTPSGLRVLVRLTPKGGGDTLDHVAVLADGRKAIKARVRAAPEDGAANAALIGLMAKTLGAAKSDVVITAGHTARLKTLDIRGDGAAFAAKLAALKEKDA